MINWYEIANLPTVERLAEILRKQLNVWVGILGPRGLVTYLGEQQAVDKPLCDAFLSRSDSRSCALSYAEWFEDLSKETAAFVFLECHAGLRGLAAPVIVGKEVVGAIFASGFLSHNAGIEEESCVFERGKELGLNRTLVSHGFRETVRLQPREAQIAGELLAQIAQSAAQHLGEKPAPEIEKPETKYDYSHIIGSSAPIKQLFKTLDKVVQSESSVLILGPPGVGKELVARAIHYNGPRANAPFVIQNCSALNDSLLDSELFGHKRGAFTGAYIDKPGLFEVADKGSFFLDEIGDMSAALQVKLLRVLQEGTFVPVGDSVTRRVDVRIIAATNKNLDEMVENGSFRRDLYYRINVITLRVPSLAERRDDIVALIQHFIEKKCHENGYKPKKISKEAMRALVQYDWPGNVRELENEVERIVVLSPIDSEIPLSVVSPRIARPYSMRESTAIAQDMVSEQLRNMDHEVNMPDTLENIEKTMIFNSLERNHWNKTKTAVELGISRRNLIRKVERFKLEELREDARKP
ncbi:MAG: sigma 54-interacting transcriptional regulator [Bradymonadia bacterium]|jgi:two-component system response regulator HupR/HoxA